MSFKDEQLALKSPFEIGMGDQYRDFSNTFACPHCHWSEQNIRLKWGQPICHGCGAELIWRNEDEL